ncbi:MAG: NYN domain-containing protein [bacterium]|nr:NYN domain-containing protein [bacterium]
MPTKIEKIKPNYAFIDGQNLYQSIKEQNWELDYRKFRVYLKEKYKVEKAYIFIGYISENQDLYTELQESGFLLKFKPVLHKEHGIKQGNVDADLALNVMRYYSEYENAVIVTSDGDFDTTVRYLRKKKKLGIVLSPNINKCSALLKIEAQDKIDFVSNFRGKVEKLKL